MTKSNDSVAGSNSTLFHIAGLGSSLGFGAMVASLFAVRAGAAGIAFEFTVPAVLAFLVSGTLAWFYWRLVARMAAEKAPEQRRKKFLIFSAGLLLVGVVAFLYPLKFIPAEKRKDVFIGLSLAVGCLTGVGLVMLKVRKFLEADLKESESDQRGQQ